MPWVQICKWNARSRKPWCNHAACVYSPECMMAETGLSIVITTRCSDHCKPDQVFVTWDSFSIEYMVYYMENESCFTQKKLLGNAGLYLELSFSKIIYQLQFWSLNFCHQWKSALKHTIPQNHHVQQNTSTMNHPVDRIHNLVANTYMNTDILHLLANTIITLKWCTYSPKYDH